MAAEPAPTVPTAGFTPLLEEGFALWAEVLIDYARDWDACFGNRESYFTQEYWYLFVGCMIEAQRGRPLTVSEACRWMKSGSNRTREERIKRAVDDGYLQKQRGESDARRHLLLPTPLLERLMKGHFERTLGNMRRLLREAGG